MLLNYAKNSNDLKRDDFLNFPLWVESGNLLDEDEVAPLLIDDSVDPVDVDKEGVYYVKTVFTLPNEVVADGYARASDGRLTFMCVFIDADRTVEFSLVEEINRAIFDADPKYRIEFLQQSQEFFPLNFKVEAALEAHQWLQGSVVISDQQPTLIVSR